MKSASQTAHTPLVLVILDGWGIAPKTPGNAIAMAKTPTVDRFKRLYPYTELAASGSAVGLPRGQDGNSEAGHMNIGAGRVVEQDAEMISREINEGTFFKNPALLDAIHHARTAGTHIHIMGLLTNGQSAHASPDHLYALLDFLHIHYGKPVYLHLFTDGRDSGRYSASKYMAQLMKNLHDHDVISTISGRFYAMDRAKNWERTERAYNAMVLADGIAADNPLKAISEAYNRGETDEFIQPTVIVNPTHKPRFISDNDTVIFFNLRSDRARQITKPFVQEDFEKQGGFKRKKKVRKLKFVGFTDFGADLDDVATAFPPRVIRNTLPFALDGLRQLCVAEREKFAHVTYFFSGGALSSSPKITNTIVPSAHVNTFDTKPQMSLAKIQHVVLKALRTRSHDVIVVNVANPDMVGHTGNLRATKKAVEYTDAFLKAVSAEVLARDGTLVVTADHGNAEELINVETKEVDTEHSNNPVPFYLVSKDKKLRSATLRSRGKLADVAPTILKILGLKKPKEMTGKSLY